MKTSTRSARHLICMMLTAVFAILCNVGVAYAADMDESTDIGSAIAVDENGIIYTVDGSSNETVIDHELAPALYMDEFRNLVYAENGFDVVSALGDAFQTDEYGNIVETTVDGIQSVVGKAPFVVGKHAENGKITLVDANDTILYFELQDGQAELVAAMTPAIYMDENGAVISVDYFGRETVISAPEGFVLTPDGYYGEMR